MISLALVGIGGYGWQLVRSIMEVSESAGCKLIGAADSRIVDLPQRADELAGKGVELFDDALKMFAQLRGRCDAVYICTGIPSHLPLTAAAAEAGYHIHLEKPPAATVQQTDEIIRAVDKAGVLCTLGFHNVYGREMRQLKDRLVSGRLGKIKSMTAVAQLPRKQSYYTRTPWAGRLRLDDEWVLDGLACNAMAHEINSMLFLAGESQMTYATPVSVRAELYRARPIECHDTAAIEIRTAGGVAARLLGSHSIDPQARPRIFIDATEGSAVWQGGTVTIDYTDGVSEEFTDGPSPRQSMVSDFVAAIREQNPEALASRPQDGRKTILVCNGAHDSSGRIHRIASEHVDCTDKGTDQAMPAICGLAEYLSAATKRHCLLSELDPPPPWAVKTEQFDLTDYGGFPQRFRCD